MFATFQIIKIQKLSWPEMFCESSWAVVDYPEKVLHFQLDFLVVAIHGQFTALKISK